MTRLSSVDVANIKHTVNKYHAKRTWSELCQRWFDSKLEAKRGEELRYMELAGEIKDLEFQVPYILCDIPKYKAKMIIDFKFKVKVTTTYGEILYWDYVYEDAKGVATEAWSVRKKWLKEKHGIDVILYRG